jgi:ATP-dependent Clp protease ATP-binding subunit ClpC
MAASVAQLTSHARRVLTLAEAEARRYNHNYLGTERLLLGLVEEGEGIAAPHQVRNRLERLLAGNR